MNVCARARAWAIALALVAGCGSSAAKIDMQAAPSDMSAAIAPLPAECDVVHDSGCAAGERCTIGTQGGAPKDLCFPIAANPIAEGGACMPVTMGNRTGDDCAAGLACVNYPGDGSKCRVPCFQRADCPSGDGCVVPTTSGTTAPFDASTLTIALRACHADDGCDPVAQTGCTSGTGCYLSGSDDFGRLGVCLVPQKQGMNGATCMVVADCAPGFRCDSFDFCRQYCYLRNDMGGPPATGQCPANEGTCGDFPFNSDRYGICGDL
jgi:hypothetical protein